ncbi:L-glutamate gamma-semialdehyde dehydrogenase [Falsiporphyromonas endometrii]|uniref:L-glutamate gamma-semialdehyde dehydrogenase n=1 Tax=Falsiporphyromonas endometrii TaxID=1387297 RepID=A0ABV9K8E2_9PORP
MNNSVFNFSKPGNEPVYSYAPGTIERKKLLDELKKQSANEIEIPIIIGGKEIRTGNTGNVVMPHDHAHKLATYHKVSDKEVLMAIEAAEKARHDWSRLPWTERASIMLRMAELISTKYRYKLAASVMLGQSKNPMQAEIDAPCELIDFLRFSAYYASKIYSDQPPLNDKGVLNRSEYRSLEGFIFAVTPFNFTSIAGNLNLAPAMMGNTTIWKPSTTALYSNYILMKIMEEAGIPEGVINFLPGQGSLIGKVAVNSDKLAGFHFTGSTETFNLLWKSIAGNIDKYKGYPRIVGETGGKNFVVVHSSAEPLEVATALVRGAFEYQGQKCSAASRAYIPRSLWPQIKEAMGDMISTIQLGDVMEFDNFMNAVIDEASFDKIMGYIERARKDADAKIIFGGEGNKNYGYFIQPTVIETTNPFYATMTDELFGPVLTVYVYEDKDYAEILKVCDGTSKYGLTGSIFSHCRYAIEEALEALRYSAGNFYINDKPTGAVVGQQPFGGARASGTNDKAGGPLNLMRWCNPRTIKETFVPPTDYTYPFLSAKD